MVLIFFSLTYNSQGLHFVPVLLNKEHSNFDGDKPENSFLLNDSSFAFVYLFISLKLF